MNTKPSPFQPPPVFFTAAVLILLLVLASPTYLTAQTTLPDGFTPLFNGKDLGGWHKSLTSHHGTSGNFYVEEEAIVLKQHPFGQGGILLTDEKFRDFELYLEFKGYPGTNGGIFFRSAESGTAYQLELAGDGDRGTGALFGEMLRTTFDVQPPDLSDIWKKDDWNSFRLRVEGEVPHVALWVNGVLQWETTASRNDLIADATMGMIALQLHWSATALPIPGGSCCGYSWKPDASHSFRNIGIKKLTPQTLASTTVVAQTADTLTSYTSSLGMEFELIMPGSVTVGRMQPECPAPPGDKQVSNTPWTEHDYRRCEELARKDSRPGFTVTIDRPFYIGKYEVTQEQWNEVMGSNPSFFQGGKVEGNSNQHPVDNVTWEQAKTFLRRLNELDTTSEYRLPTEFEWEYAAKAGATELLSWKETKEQAWIQDTDKGSTLPVGQLKPNAWGLHDMLGNVWEWTEDFHNGKFFPDPVPPAAGQVHVLRGGSFTSDVTNATYIFHGGGPGNGYDVGFRVVRESK